MTVHRVPAVHALELFDEKVERVLRRSFVKQYQETRNFLTISATKQVDGWDVQTNSRRADDESVEAVALTLRFFIQDNEPCSLRNLHRIYNETPQLGELSQRFNDARDYINSVLDNSVEPQKADDGPLVYRDVLNAFLFGDLSHSENKHRLRFATWQANPMSSAIYTHIFHHLVYEIFAVCENISHINSDALVRLRT